MARACRSTTAVTLLSASVAFLGGQCAASASTFLDHRAHDDAQWKGLLNELEAALGSGRRAAAEARVTQFEDAMRPVFAALPRLHGERLASSSVRYLLHRTFAERHGWFVEGLASMGEAWNSSSPTAFFAEHAGEAQSAFERRLGSQGLSLRETAVFAATLESLVHEETLARLHSTYRVLGLDAKEDSAREQEVERVVDTYMMMLVLGLDHSSVDPKVVSRAWAHIETIYPTWGETQKWVREVRKEVVSATPETRTAFATTVRVLEEIADRYGRWQDSECIDLKSTLMRYEREGTGRVPLKDFYGAAVNGSFQFTERQEYLQQLGVLDVSRPSQPSVIISNYINGASNCLASSKFYSVCCISECEALMKPLERHIAAPEALPGRIVELVEQLPSATVDAPRSLPAALIQRLEEIAEQHGGRVPLHGRLFAQWMHHAYPRECSYPHISGTTQHLTATQYKEMHGTSFAHNASTLHVAVEAFSQEDEGADDGEVASMSLPWSTEEELFFALPPRQWGHELRRLARWLMMVLAASSMSVATLRAAAGGQAAFCGQTGEKYTV